MGKFIIESRSDGQYYFRLKSDNGETILVSEGYTSKSGCLNAIGIVKMYALFNESYDRRKYNEQHYFLLRSNNGEIVGISEKYSTLIASEKGILMVQKIASDAIVSDLSKLDKYYVNQNTQANGDHEVHKASCSFMPEPQHRTYLGEFSSCQAAVRKAKEKFRQSNGCYYCNHECHIQ